MNAVLQNGVMTLFFIVVCMILSGFFSGSETAVTALNRYRLQYLANIKKNQTAERLLEMLRHPQKLLGMILIANTFLNMLVSSLTTAVIIEWLGQEYVLLSTVILTFLVLVFAEVLPKSVAAYRPDAIAFKVARILSTLLTIMGPVVAVVNLITAGVLRLFGMRLQAGSRLSLSRDEIGGLIKLNRQKKDSEDEVEQMLEGILDLDEMTVGNVMQPRADLIGIDLTDRWHEIIGYLKNTKSRNMIIYKSQIDDIQGYIGCETIMKCLLENKLSKETLVKRMKKANYIPETTKLEKQLKYFKENHENLAVVVDEYGHLCGIVERSDIIDEVIGCYAQGYPMTLGAYSHQGVKEYWFYGNVTVRDINKTMQWQLPEEGANTIGGVIIEHLEHIPEGGLCTVIAGYKIEILQMKNNKVHRLKIIDPAKKKEAEKLG